jgi:hypothetical protein
MGNLIQNDFQKNERITRGNLTGLSTTGTQLLGEKGLGINGKIPLGKADEEKVLDVNSAYEELKNNKHIFAKTPDGREIEITSLEQLKQLNLNDQTAGMGAASRNNNARASYYNTFTPYNWPKMGASQVSDDGSRLQGAGYAPFMPPFQQYGMQGGYFPGMFGF